MSKKVYKIDMNSSVCKDSRVPIVIQLRMELNRQGMKFVDDGRPSAAWNNTPVPLGKCVTWTEVESPDIIYWSQELEEEDNV